LQKLLIVIGHYFDASWQVPKKKKVISSSGSGWRQPIKVHTNKGRKEELIIKR
jgi:hypothetical protein